MLSIKVRKKRAETLRKKLIKLGLLRTKDKIIRDETYVYLPLTDYAGQNIKSLSKLGGVLHKSAVEKRLRAAVPSIGYDLLGDIAVIDAKRKRLSQKEILVEGKRIISSNPRVSTVLSKAGPVSGKFRTRKFSYVCGKRSFIAHYKENGAFFEFDVRKVFFSSRLAYERARISSVVKKGEVVAVPFAGVGPFPIVIAKNADPKTVVAIELNAVAFRYLLKNIKANKVMRIKPELGDFRKLADDYKGIADRVIMQMPTKSTEFIEPMLKISKRSGKSHIYLFCDKDKIDDVKSEIRNNLLSYGYTTRFTFERVVRSYSKSEVEMVFDISFRKR